MSNKETATMLYFFSGRREKGVLKGTFLAISAGHEEYLSQIYIDECILDVNCELELGRFKLQAGTRLRTEYVLFYDYSFSTVILIMKRLELSK